MSFRHREGFSDAYAAEQPFYCRGTEVQRRNKFPLVGTGIIKTVSERRCPEGFSDAYAAEQPFHCRGTEVQRRNWNRRNNL